MPVMNDKFAIIAKTSSENCRFLKENLLFVILKLIICIKCLWLSCVDV
jgi:hypothetical protein